MVCECWAAAGAKAGISDPITERRRKDDRARRITGTPTRDSELIVQTMELVALPIELLVSIIGHLDFQAILRCREVSILAGRACTARR